MCASSDYLHTSFVNAPYDVPFPKIDTEGEV